MKFHFKKIGPVKEAELELGDFTLIAGRNNTGKTYLAYTLYGFLKQWREWPEVDRFFIEKIGGFDYFPDMKGLVEEMKEKGQARYPVDRKTLDKQRKAVMRRLARAFSRSALAHVFSSSREKFEGASLEIKFENTLSAKESFDSAFLDSRGKNILSIHYDGDNVVVTDNVKDKRSHVGILEALPYLYLQFLFPEFPEPFILSAERIGISLFYKELDFTKNQLVDLLQKMGDDKDNQQFSPFLLIDRTTSRYALPIKDNIDYTRNISRLKNEKSEIFGDKSFDDIKNMMGGYYRSSGDDIRFKSKARKDRSFDIPLHLASSSARGLSDLYFFLRHKACKNHLLIVDEPESHLDTENQIMMARLLARFIRVGLKVLVTTHSDYIVKEINNLIMLSSLSNKEIRMNVQPRYSEGEWIEPGSIRAYVAGDGTLSACSVDKYGIDMPVFDNTIDNINRVSNELVSLLTEDGP